MGSDVYDPLRTLLDAMDIKMGVQHNPLCTLGIDFCYRGVGGRSKFILI